MLIITMRDDPEVRLGGENGNEAKTLRPAVYESKNGSL
jgi:hypothetical protein